MGSTPKGIPYPDATDLIKQPSVPSKLAQDIQAAAIGADVAIGAEGARAVAKAAQDAQQKYGALPSQIAAESATNTRQDADLDAHETRIGAIETLGGLAPGDVSDATMTSVAANQDSTFRAQQAQAVSDGSGTIDPTTYPTFAEAVTAAHQTGRALIVDTDLATDVVPRTIYEVPLVGKGSITVGGNKWWVNPQHLGIQTNRLYINPTTGSDANAGIDPGAPIKTFNRLGIMLTMLREKLLDGFWEIIIQAGTHTIDQGWRLTGLRTRWPLTIKGEGNLETTIDGSNDSLGKAFYFKHFQTEVNFENLRVQNYVGGSANDGIDTSAGFLLQGPGRVSFNGVEVLDCTTGISVGYGITAAIHSSTIRGSAARSLNGTVATGITVIYGASATIGSSGGLGNTITHCGTGVRVSRNSVAHVDYNDLHDNYYGLQVLHNARAAIITDDFRRNMIGINLAGGAELTYGTAVYGEGADANVEYNMRIGGSARLTSLTGASTAATEYRIATEVHDPAVTTPNNQNRNPIVTFPSTATIPAGILKGEGKTLRCVVRGNIPSTSGQRRFELSKNDREGQNHGILGAVTMLADTTGPFTLEFVVQTLPVQGSVLYHATLTVSDGTSLQSNGRLMNRDISHDWRIRLYQENRNSPNDVIEIRSADLYLTG